MRASFYGYESGTVTATGERYDPMKYTCAHRDSDAIPYGSIVIVESIKTGRIVVTRKNDYGPNVRLKDRQIDLSYAAARDLEMLHDGLADVRVTVIPAIEEE